MLLKHVKTNFTAGELSPSLFGRGDLRAYDNGASKLRNVFVAPTGGALRRHGLRFVAEAAGPGRLLAFEFNTAQVYLLALSDIRLDVYKDGVSQATVNVPWTEAQIGALNWTQSADTLLIVHPDVAPRRITRTSHTSWTISEWEFHAVNGRRMQPHYKFAARGVTMSASATTGVITLTCSVGVFETTHVGTRFRLNNKEVEINQVPHTGGGAPGTLYATAQATVIETLTGTAATEDWTEQAWSAVRGWPTSVCFHQDRLVIGGSRDLPNRLWLSKSADYFNFDLGTGLDDDGIELPVLADQVNAIRHVFPGRDLQVFTSGAEWRVTGDPLTPKSIQLQRQTRVGSPIDRTVPPVDIDGATVFVPRRGSSLREFIYTDSEAAYEAPDMALLSRHLLRTPVDAEYDEPNRWLHLVNSDGTLATCTVYRDEQVTAWSLQETAGQFMSVANVGDDVYVLVIRDGGALIERLDAALNTDSAVTGTSGTPQTVWSGLGHLEGKEVRVVADGADVGLKTVTGGAITLASGAVAVEAGLAFQHRIEPLPLSVPSGQQATPGIRLRPVRITFTLEESRALRVDVGLGFRAHVLSPLPFSGEIGINGGGWRSSKTAPLWMVSGDQALDVNVLMVESEVAVNE